ncbi:MAG: hypothetical protein JWO28_50 [Hyphomicrobiales bacterium]|nr:hypothetical protein [Hyphomicrobiales bacterium]
MSDAAIEQANAEAKAAADGLDAKGMREADKAYWRCRKSGQGRNRSLRAAVAAYLDTANSVAGKESAN